MAYLETVQYAAVSPGLPLSNDTGVFPQQSTTSEIVSSNGCPLDMKIVAQS